MLVKKYRRLFKIIQLNANLIVVYFQLKKTRNYVKISYVKKIKRFNDI